MASTKAIRTIRAKKSQRKETKKNESQKKKTQKLNTKKSNAQEKKPQKKFFEYTNEERQKLLDDFEPEIKDKEGSETERSNADSEAKKLPLKKFDPSWNVFKNPIYTGHLPDKIIIGGPTLKYDLDRDIEAGRRRVQEHYRMICQEDDGLNPGLAERIRDVGLKNLKRHRQQMESINWREFFKDVEIPWPTKPTVIKPRRISDEERDARLCGHK